MRRQNLLFAACILLLGVIGLATIAWADPITVEGIVNEAAQIVTDGGETWGEQQVVWHDEGNTCGNPCPVVEMETGTIWLFSTWNLGKDCLRELCRGLSKDTRRVFVIRSDDDGVTWSKSKEITDDVKKENWAWYATGPCNGIQLTQRLHKGRLVIPCNHSTMGAQEWCSHVIYSDDHGASWKIGGQPSKPNHNESTVAELSDGRLMLNMRGPGRSRNAPTNVRLVSVSDDGGESWSEPYGDQALPEPKCQGSLLRYEHEGKVYLLFSNPATRDTRTNLTVRLSKDGGETWPISRAIQPGFCAYSCLCTLPNGDIGCLYEDGEKGSYERISLARFSITWLISED